MAVVLPAPFGPNSPYRCKSAALRVPRRVRELLRIDIYAVSDDGQVEKVSDSEALEVEREAEKLAGETVVPSRPKKAAKSDWKSWPNPEKLEYLLSKTTIPDRVHMDEQRLPARSAPTSSAGIRLNNWP